MLTSIISLDQNKLEMAKKQSPQKPIVWAILYDVIADLIEISETSRKGH